jgi:plastocyanin
MTGLNRPADRGVKQVMENNPGPRSHPQRFALLIAGAALLVATGAIHLDLYLTGYRHIPTIGWLFLLQVITAFALAAGLLLIRSPLLAAAGAGFAASTLAGYLLSLWIGLFGFTEVRTTAGIVAAVIEIGAFCTLAAVALTARPAAGPARSAPARAGGPLAGLAAAAGWLAELSSAQRAMAGRAVAGLAAAALVVLGVSVAGAGGGGSPTASQPPPPGAGSVLTVVIKNFTFSPADPKATPGERIEVKNEDAVAHTLSAGPAAKFAKAFNTGQVAPGQVAFFTAPKKAGAYPFYCMVHHFMTGMLVVGNASASASLRAAIRARPPSYCGRQHTTATATATAARRPPAGRFASGD